MNKISIRFFNDREVRAIWDEQNSKWWFSVLDIIWVLTDQDDYLKNRNYWKYLKAKLKKEDNQLVSNTTQLKLVASDGKKYLSDVFDYDSIVKLGKIFPYLIKKLWQINIQLKQKEKYEMKAFLLIEII